MTISAKSFYILTTSFRVDDLSFLHKYIQESGHATWQPCLLTDQIRFSIFLLFLPNDVEF